MSHLLQKNERRLWEGLSAPRNVFTWKSGNGNEIDFLVVDRAKKRMEPYEVKYQETVSDWDFQVSDRAFGKATIISKITSKVRPKGAALPLHIFLSNDI
jgi:predicted AAA+ superfamily ATPase